MSGTVAPNRTAVHLAIVHVMTTTPDTARRPAAARREDAWARAAQPRGGGRVATRREDAWARAAQPRGGARAATRREDAWARAAQPRGGGRVATRREDAW